MFAYEEQTAIMTKKIFKICWDLPESITLVKSINPKLLT